MPFPSGQIRYASIAKVLSCLNNFTIATITTTTITTTTTTTTTTTSTKQCQEMKCFT